MAAEARHQLGYRVLAERSAAVPLIASTGASVDPSPRSHIFDIIPDWICEVTSPGSVRLDRVRKLPVCARNLVAFVWMVDPEQQTFEAYRNAEGEWILFSSHGGAEVIRVEPFDAIEIDLASIWGPPED